MKNRERADAVRGSLIAFLKTDEAACIFGGMELCEKGHVKLGREIEVSVKQVNDHSFILSICNSTEEGFVEYKTTFKIK